MALKDVMHDIEGYDAVLTEIEVARRYGTDYTAQQGKLKRIIDSLHPKALSLKVSEISEATPSAKVFRLVAAGGYLPPFQAGQYINLCVELGGVRTSRPYSIASPPSQSAYYEIAVRAVPDGFVSDYLLKNVAVGDEFVSSGPAGNFYYNPLFHGDDLVFLAGGSGITPFMSMIRETTDRGLPVASTSSTAAARRMTSSTTPSWPSAPHGTRISPIPWSYPSPGRAARGRPVSSMRGS